MSTESNSNNNNNINTVAAITSCTQCQQTSDNVGCLYVIEFPPNQYHKGSEFKLACQYCIRLLRLCGAPIQVQNNSDNNLQASE